MEHVSKRYLLGEHHGSSGSLRETASNALRRLLRRGAPAARDELWSLRDVSLEVAEGETLGIIGRNGAGKSTLLKILTRITEPSSGVARTRGRVGSLLEVGVGFHPELSGRENVYLNGALLGMTRREIAARFDAIVDFSGVGRFLDTPVKRYSSGMYLRLAFAVAAHLEAEIMAIDEVLAVGDAEFQRKCLGKMSSLEQDGRTVLFVSHNLDAIARLCPTTVWLDKGRVEAWGPTTEVIDAYLATGFAPAEQKTFAVDAGGPVAVQGLTVLDARGNVTGVIDRDEPWTVEIRFTIRERVPELDMTIFAHTRRGLRVLEEAWSEAEPDNRGAPGSYVTRVMVPPVLVAGEYILGLWLGSPYETLLYEEEALHFRLEGSVRGRSNRVVQLGLPWDVRRLPESAATS